MTPFERYLRDPRPTPEEVRARVEAMLKHPMTAADQWLAEQVKIAMEKMK